MLKQRRETTDISLVRAWIPTALVIAAGLLFAPAALADSSFSSNWAGYAVHRPGISFRKISASWKQPSATCTKGVESFSAYWVGLGGFSQTSTALEQIGTETDCSLAGTPVFSMWYELVPAPSTPIRLSVGPGDDISASVTVRGRRVTLSVYDATRHHGFKKTLRASAIDVSSAEWIVEAPSDCTVSINACRTLPLADFGSAAFTSTLATGSKGHVGSISSPRWDSTKINLSPGGRRFVAYQGEGASAGAAQPSVLQAGGTAFTVTFSKVALQGNPLMTPRMAATTLSGHLFH
jgi:hypothetical protein